jgi:hypothetical protein
MLGPSPRRPIRATDRRSPDRGGLHAGIAVDALGEFDRMRNHELEASSSPEHWRPTAGEPPHLVSNLISIPSPAPSTTQTGRATKSCATYAGTRVLLWAAASLMRGCVNRNRKVRQFQEPKSAPPRRLKTRVLLIERG